jgi:four helix bundle protein
MRKIVATTDKDTFEKIKAWQLARSFKIELRNIVKKFPSSEKFSLASQIQRAAISITANIAEGYGRYHFQENIQFCRQARGSISEILDHLYTALDYHYIDKNLFESLYTEGRAIEKAINGYIKFLQSQKEKFNNPQ